MKIIFLDIDGVLNCEKGFKNGWCKYNDDYGMDFFPPSSLLINRLIEETKAKIVISSTWRSAGLKEMRKMWKHRNMSGEIIDITPRMWSYERENYIHNGKEKPIKYHLPRGIEIDQWLQWNDFRRINWSEERQLEYMEKSGIDNYVIIDDDSDFLYSQREHFVHVVPSPRNRDGFKLEHYEQAKCILEKNFIDLYYA